MREHIDYFKNSLKELNIELDEVQIEKFIKYYEMLIEKNKVMNLTAITEPLEVISKHFLDSLSIVKVIDVNSINKVIDIGTGAGFPGIPLKIAFPHLNIILLDSLSKRIKFLDEVIEALELKDIKGIHGRSEELAQNKEYREKFDLVVSRAVANLATLSEFCIPFAKKNGFFISYKGPKCLEEVEISKGAVDKLGGKVDKIVEFFLDNGEQCRNFVKIEKIKETPKKYPRKAGTPLKEPLN